MAATETVTLLVTSGRGPAECARALADFVAAMAEAATAAGLDLATDADGARPSASVVLSGPGAATFARRWTGNVQWTDASLRGRGARRNWYLAAILMPQRPEPAALDPREVRIEAMRAGGPGGQHQNTTDSAVRAVHLPTGLSAIARDGRSQHANRALAIERLGGCSSRSTTGGRSRPTGRRGWRGSRWSAAIPRSASALDGRPR